MTSPEVHKDSDLAHVTALPIKQREGYSNSGVIKKWQHLIAYLLTFFMTLASNQQNISRLQMPDRFIDSALAVANLDTASGAATRICSTDGGRLFRCADYRR